MPRLDTARLTAWSDLHRTVLEIHRLIDDELRREWAVPLGSFEVLAALRATGGRIRPLDLADQMRIPASSLSRRLDGLEAEGWVERHRQVDPADRRTVEVELTRRGRTLWREMNVTYRRAVQRRFAGGLTDQQIEALTSVLMALSAANTEDRQTPR